MRTIAIRFLVVIVALVSLIIFIAPVQTQAAPRAESCPRAALGVECDLGYRACPSSGIPQCKLEADINAIRCRADQDQVLFDCGNCRCVCPSGQVECGVVPNKVCKLPTSGTCTTAGGQAGIYSDQCGTCQPLPPDPVIFAPTTAQEKMTELPAVNLKQKGAGLLLNLQAQNGEDSTTRRSILSVDRTGLMVGWDPDSTEFGINLGTSGSPNLFFGVAKDVANEAASLLKLQLVPVGGGSPSNRFRVDLSGNVEASGKVKGSQLCINADCRNAWPEGVAAGGVSLQSATPGTTQTGNIHISGATRTGRMVLADSSPIEINAYGANVAFGGSEISEPLYVNSNGSMQIRLDADDATDTAPDLYGGRGPRFERSEFGINNGTPPNGQRIFTIDEDGVVALSGSSLTIKANSPQRGAGGLEDVPLQVESDGSIQLRLDANDNADAIAEEAQFKIKNGVNSSVFAISEQGVVDLYGSDPKIRNVNSIEGQSQRIVFDANDVRVKSTGTTDRGFSVNAPGSDTAYLRISHDGSRAYLMDSVSNSAVVIIDGVPSGSAVTQAAFVVNPSSATANQALFGVAVNGAEKFRVDAEGDMYVKGASYFGTNSASTIDSTGKIPAITSTYFANLSGSALTNLNASALTSGTIDAARLPALSTLSTSSPITFTGAPTGTGVLQGSLMINPASATTNYNLFGVAVSGADKLRLDAEGDLDVAGSIQAGSGNVTIVNGAGKIPAISSTYFANLDGSAITNLNASNITTGTIGESRLPTTFTRPLTFTGAPIGAGALQGSLVINLASAEAGKTIFGVTVNNVRQFSVDSTGKAIANIFNGTWVEGSTVRANALLELPEVFSASTTADQVVMSKNSLVKGTQGFDAAGENAIMYLGNTDHFIKSTYGQGVTIGTYYQSDALKIAENTGAVSTIGDLSVGGNMRIVGAQGFDATGDDAPLYLGDTNHFIKGTNGQGVTIGTYGKSDALKIEQGTGNVRLSGSQLVVAGNTLTVGGRAVLSGLNYVNRSCTDATVYCKVTCSSGESVIGGGCYTRDGKLLFASYPEAAVGGQGANWTCGADPRSSGIIAYAICAKLMQ
ncbi:MAG: hypothetical protein V1723_04685 [Candidatus Uhrbacteria bacterium]